MESVPSFKMNTVTETYWLIHAEADFQQGMESVPLFKMNTVTETYWLIYAEATVIWPYRVGYYFQSLS